MVRLFAFINHSKKEPKVKHHMGFPPEVTIGEDQRSQLSWPTVLILEQKPDGFFLYRYAMNGNFGGDTWHKTENEAKEQAEFEYEDLLGEWQEIPEDVEDAIEYAIQAARKN